MLCARSGLNCMGFHSDRPTAPYDKGQQKAKPSHVTVHWGQGSTTALLSTCDKALRTPLRGGIASDEIYRREPPS